MVRFHRRIPDPMWILSSPPPDSPLKGTRPRTRPEQDLGGHGREYVPGDGPGPLSATTHIGPLTQQCTVYEHRWALDAFRTSTTTRGGWFPTSRPPNEYLTRTGQVIYFIRKTPRHRPASSPRVIATLMLRLGLGAREVDVSSSTSVGRAHPQDLRNVQVGGVVPGLLSTRTPTCGSGDP